MARVLTEVPRPQVGATVHRYTLNGVYENALVVSVIGPVDQDETWTATLMTRNGVDFVGSGRENRTKYDWVPLAWYFDEIGCQWRKPEDSFDGWNIPDPMQNERYQSWRARVVKAIPELKARGDLTAMLSEIWQTKQEAPLAASAK